MENELKGDENEHSTIISGILLKNSMFHYMSTLSFTRDFFNNPLLQHDFLGIQLLLQKEALEK